MLFYLATLVISTTFCELVAAETWIDIHREANSGVHIGSRLHPRVFPIGVRGRSNNTHSPYQSRLALLSASESLRRSVYDFSEQLDYHCGWNYQSLIKSSKKLYRDSNELEQILNTSRRPISEFREQVERIRTRVGDISRQLRDARGISLETKRSWRLVLSDLAQLQRLICSECESSLSDFRGRR